MLGIIGQIYTLVIYQPFFNLLVGIYMGLQFLFPGQADMGIAVIIFTVIFRILWLPISLSSDRSEKEKRAIGKEVKQINELYKNEPIKKKQEIKKLLGQNKRILISSTVNIAFQVIIALMLYRIFAKGLEGADFHLLYKFMPKIDKGFNLVFLGKYDLSKPNIFLNLMQSLSLFITEILSTVFSPFPATKRDLLAIVTLPTITFLYFYTMPAGKKLFVITTFCFSIVFMVVKRIIFVYHTITEKLSTLPARFQKKQEVKN